MNEIFSKVKKIESSNDGSLQVKGFKKKEGKKGTKRWKKKAKREKQWKGCVEVNLLTNRKKHGGSSASQIQEHMVLTY